jgi:uncharacterized oxidoreductase
MKSSGNTILLTGGSRGIGRRLAEEWAKAGNRVIVTGRDADALEEVVAGTDGIVAGYLLDMEDGDAIQAFAQQMADKHPDLDVLVNNAGIMVAEDLHQPNPALSEKIVVTNLLGPIRLTAALLPHLLARPAATVVTVSSGLAFVPLATTPTYCATKAAIHSWSLSLREQLKDTGVEVVELVPPGVQTDLMPGHATNPQMMPLEEFIAETIGLFAQAPTPREVAVGRVDFLYKATAEDRFDRTFAALNSGARE